MNKILGKNFYKQSALEVAPLLIGKILIRKLDNNEIIRLRITEVEVYYGEEDSACHARVGKTERTEIMYEEGGYAYVYLCYGIHYILNIITGPKNHPEGIMIRGVEDCIGPGRVTKKMNVTKDLNKHDLTKKEKLWIEDDGFTSEYITKPRVGIDYASEPYKSIPWRFVMKK